VLGYTTPLWVAPAACIFLKEPMPLLRLVGVGLGLAGLLVLFDPSRFDWRSSEAVAGNGLVLLAALCWSMSIVYTRAHRWIGTPFQLIVWQTMLSVLVLAGLAFAFEGAPELGLSAPAVLSLVYTGAIGTALGFWAMMTVNKELPATVTSLGVLATPVVGLLLSALMLHERIDAPLAVASLLISTGIGDWYGLAPLVSRFQARRRCLIRKSARRCQQAQFDLSHFAKYTDSQRMSSVAV
jgi:drug/metabolite transporter (DMT)-like permease